jgi:hypothetical protein
MIPSVTMASFIHRESVHDESTTFIVFIGATALEPPIHRSLVTDADIRLGPPTYHSRPLKWWGFLVRDLCFDFSSLEILLEDSISWLKFIFF